MLKQFPTGILIDMKMDLSQKTIHRTFQCSLLSNGSLVSKENMFKTFLPYDPMLKFYPAFAAIHLGFLIDTKITFLKSHLSITHIISNFNSLSIFFHQESYEAPPINLYNYSGGHVEIWISTKISFNVAQ